MMSETVVTVESGRPNPAAPPKPAAPQQPAGPLSWITFNTAYFQTVPGILKLIELVSEFSFQLITLNPHIHNSTIPHPHPHPQTMYYIFVLK